MADDALRWLVAFSTRRRSDPPDVSTVDPSDFGPPALEAARLVWRRRVINEALSVGVAARLRDASARLACGGEVDRALTRLEEDESAHVEIARGVLDRLGGSAPSASEEMDLPAQPLEQTMARLVLTGLAVCETISAARFAAVREHTDLPLYRACIELFHRDELAHAELGFVMLPSALERFERALGREAARELVGAELRQTFGYLDHLVGLDLERSGGPPPPRPQPVHNPGVVEPVIDAIAFYRAIHETILPRLSGLGLPAADAWANRGAP